MTAARLGPTCRRALRVLAAAVVVTAIAPAPARAGEFVDITVMSRNLYLGADVGPAMELLPDLGAAATFMWQQVHQTNFTVRADSLAQEIADATPHVVALQEATVWSCAPHAWSRSVPVYDFTAILLDALDARGQRYGVATAGGAQAVNPGFTIGPIPGLTVVRDPDVFQPMFGTDTAACGFRIADTLLVRQGVDVERVGTSEFTKSYSVVPLVMTVHRGYSWADVRVDGAVARVVTTHLESMFDPGGVPTAKLQADQLVADLSSTTLPLIVAGDFNSDPRDPREQGAPNPGEQPQVNSECPAQTGTDARCSAYWTMLEVGFQDAGPDAARHLSWGFGALLDGPDSRRPAGMTDRLDYVFTRNGAVPKQARLIDATFPTAISWTCGSARCAPSDHAGLVVTVRAPAGSTAGGPTPPAHDRGPIGPGRATLLVGAGAMVLVLRRRQRRRRSQTADQSPAEPAPTG